MLEKLTMPRTLQFSDFSFLPVKCSACLVSWKSAIECGIVFSEIHLSLKNHSLEFHEISHKNILGNK